MCTKFTCIIDLYTGNTWIWGAYISSISIIYAWIKGISTKRAIIGAVYTKNTYIRDISTYLYGICIGTWGANSVSTVKCL